MAQLPDISWMSDEKLQEEILHWKQQASDSERMSDQKMTRKIGEILAELKDEIVSRRNRYE